MKPLKNGNYKSQWTPVFWSFPGFPALFGNYILKIKERTLVCYEWPLCHWAFGIESDLYCLEGTLVILPLPRGVCVYIPRLQLHSGIYNCSIVRGQCTYNTLYSVPVSVTVMELKESDSLVLSCLGISSS